MRIEPVQRRQFSDWKRLRRSLYTGLDESFHDEEMQWIFASPDSYQCFLALGEEGEAVGLLEVSLRSIVDGCIGGPVGYIEGMYLAPERRGAGLGRRMVEHAAEWFRSRGCRDMATDAEIDNVAAQEFYLRAGFTETWRTVGFHKPLQ